MAAQHKTEAPTPKKLREARERGDVPRSRELQSAAVVLAASAALAVAGGHALDRLAASFYVAWAAAGGQRAGSPGAVLHECAVLGAEAVAPVLVVALGAGTVAGFLQVGPLATLRPLAPRAERLDPVRGAGRLLSAHRLAELFKVACLLVLIGAVAWLTLGDAVRGISSLPAQDAPAVLQSAGPLLLALIVRVGTVLGAIAVLDLLYQRWRYHQDQKMTREEAQRERRETQGDPHSKRARERAHRQILEHGMIEAVREADVVVTHSTHVAAALRYDADEHAAPQVTAVGRDVLARRMIDVARTAGVPVPADAALAHALSGCEVGEPIPETLYEPVAVLLRAAWQRRAYDETRP